MIIQNLMVSHYEYRWSGRTSGGKRFRFDLDLFEVWSDDVDGAGIDQEGARIIAAHLQVVRGNHSMFLHHHYRDLNQFLDLNPSARLIAPT